jgi:hypothetical protein
MFIENNPKKNGMKNKLKFAAVILALVTMTGCYPGSDRTLENTEVVFTDYENTFEFSKNKTYFLIDEVFSIDTTKTIPADDQNTILNSIRSNMDSRGWTEEPIDSLNVGVVIMSSALKSTVDGVNYWPGYGGWWGGWWGYPGYPGYGWGGTPIYYSYDIGTIYIDMVDPSTYDPDDDKSLQLVWMSAMNGVLSSTATNHSRIQRVINQAFTQSPYL